MIVYGLLDPRTRELRYVGQTVRALRKRISQHMLVARTRTNPPVNAWLRGLQSDGLAPDTIELDCCDDTKALNDAETFWIESMRAIGANLLKAIIYLTNHE